MNFFENQDRARAKTRTLVGLFIFAVIAIIAVINAAVVFIFFSTMEGLPQNLPTILFFTSVIALAAIFLTSASKWMSIRRYGGAYVAKQLGGRKLDPGTREPKERVLLNVVEEMAIASGIPVPEVYILEEDGINAFAAGLSTHEAVIGVTRGCLHQLTRDELQGVIAHEFSHIFNSDMSLNMKLMGVLHGILVFSLIGRMMLYSGASGRRGRGKGGGQVAIFGVVC